MLTPADEQFNHQLPLPHAVVGSSDPAWRERYWVSIQDVLSKDVVVSCGLGQYPNADVQEAFVALATPTTQYNLRLSRSLLPQREAMAVGPFSVDIREPWRRVGFSLGPNATGVTFDLEFRSDLAPCLEDRHFEVRRGRVVHDLVRYVQLGRAAGRLRLPDGEREVAPDRWWAQRDHSWGIRPMPKVPGAPPSSPPEWRFMLFCPLQFEGAGAYCYLYEGAVGQPLYLSGGLMGGDQAEEDRLVALDHDLVWSGPVRTLDSGHLGMRFASGRRLDVELTGAPTRAFLRGGGYGGIGSWYQGQWKGDDVAEHDVWDLTDPERLPGYARNSSDHLVDARLDGGEVGHGIVEYMVLPGHHRYKDLPDHGGAR